MTTKATRDVIDLGTRAVTTIVVSDDPSATVADGVRQIDDTVIGSVTPNEGTFTNIVADNITVNTNLDISGATVTGTFNAYYADVAERYMADEVYEAGTVVKIGGENEITASDEAGSDDVFGVISTNPAWVLNQKYNELYLQDDELYLPVALAGRVPVFVVGDVKKGQRLTTSSLRGVAMAAHEGINPLAVIGRSLVDSEGLDVRKIEMTTVK